MGRDQQHRAEKSSPAAHFGGKSGFLFSETNRFPSSLSCCSFKAKRSDPKVPDVFRSDKKKGVDFGAWRRLGEHHALRSERKAAVTRFWRRVSEEADSGAAVFRAAATGDDFPRGGGEAESLHPRSVCIPVCLHPGLSVCIPVCAIFNSAAQTRKLHWRCGRIQKATMTLITALKHRKATSLSDSTLSIHVSYGAMEIRFVR